MPKSFRPYALLIGGLLVGLLLAAPFIQPEGQRPRRAEPPPNTTVEWNESTGTPDWLDGPLPYTLSQAEQANPELAARNVLNFYKDLFGIQNASAEFELVRIETDALGQTHVRLQQVRDGIPVWSRVMLVHLGENQVLGINGDFQPDLTLSTDPAVTASEAESQALAVAYGDNPALYAPSRLMIYVGDDGQAHLTWQVKINTVLPGGNTAYFVDAVNGGLVHESPLTASDKYREVYDAQLKDNLPGRFLAAEGTVPRDPAGKAAYQNAGLVYDYWKNTFGRDSYDDNGGPIYLIIHSPELGNSYWNGQVLVFGDKDDYITNKDDAYVLDIMGHEFTHAVIQYTADLVYETQSGALNESFADVFAVMIDRDDWRLFEDNSASPPLPVPWLRDMQDPSLNGDYDPKKPRSGFGQPTFMSEYANLPNSRDGDWGGVHVNSGIPNHVLYLAATASSREATEQIWYRALATYLTPKSNFADFATAIQKSAADLYGANSAEANAVKAALTESGIIKGSGGTTSQPTPVPTTSSSTAIQPTPVPAVASGCSELTVNGTFENARSDPWVEKTNLNAPIIGADFPHTGKKSAWLGGTDQETFQYIYQDIAIAANLKSVTLTYWHYLEENAESGAPDAVFDALLADPKSGDVIATLEELASSKSDEKWAQSTIDLSGYAGKKVRLAFTANMVRGNLSNFFVDDVSVVACTTAAAPVTGGSTVTVTGKITDAASGKAVEGATFYVLKVTVAQATKDGKLSADEVLAKGVSDRKGAFKLDKKLARGQSYNVVVLANGYKTLAVDNAFEILANDPDPLDLDVQLQRR
jgi:bacillolysin/thermolysin